MLILWPLYERLGLSVLLLIPFLFASLTWVMRRYVLLTSKYAITEIILKTNSEYVLAVGGDGLYVLATLRRGSYVHPLLIILNFKLKRWPWYVSVPLLTDSADEDALRRLRVRLRTMRDGELETLA
ncbi:MAG: hypothetical protein KAV87_13795 [Desulfobacteraceae bacterium]|nr:hypothetical protein [Desulfobacteraceae bacterium]